MSNTTYNGFPRILNGTEYVYLNRTGIPDSRWTALNFTYNSTTGYYQNEVNRIIANDTLSFVIRINNTGYGNITNMHLYKQLPASNNASTGNATFSTNNISYWASDPSEVGWIDSFAPDAYNHLTLDVTSGPLNYVSPGKSMYFQINGTLSNVTGNVPSGSANAYVNFSPAYFTFTTSDTSHSYLGGMIDNRSYTWITAGGDASFDLEKTYNPDLGWRFRVLVYNPTDITFNLNQSATNNMTYMITGNALMYISTNTYVVGIDPMVDPGSMY
jgi:hypothetical protein